MPIIELDPLIAFINKADKHHNILPNKNHKPTSFFIRIYTPKSVHWKANNLIPQPF